MASLITRVFGDASESPSRSRRTSLLDHYDEQARRGPRALYQFGRLTDQQIANLIDGNWLARRIVRALPEASWGSDLVFADQAQADEWAKLNTNANTDDGSFLTGAIWAQAFGKCIVLKGYDYSGALDQPLGQVLGEIQFLEPITPQQFEVRADDLNKDPNNPQRYGLPEYYRIIPGRHRFGGQRIHYSRFVEFVGPTATSPDNMRNRIAGVHLSVLDPVWLVIQEYGQTWESISTLIRQASIPIFKMKGAIKGLAAEADAVLQRMDVMVDQMDVSKAVVLDADENEDYRREAVSFADLPAMTQQLSIKIAAAGGIPLGELFGRIISGLGDSEAGETAKWNRRISSYRTRTLAPRIQQIVGNSEQTVWEFAPLVTPTRKEEYDLAKGYWDVGAVDDNEMRLKAEDALNLEHVEGWVPPDKRTTTPDPGATETSPAAPAVGAPAEPDPSTAETPGGGTIEVTASGAEGVITANQFARSKGLPPITKPDGTPDPDGNLPMSVYTAKKKAEAEAAAQVAIDAAAALAAQQGTNGNQANPSDPSATPPNPAA